MTVPEGAVGASAAVALAAPVGEVAAAAAGSAKVSGRHQPHGGYGGDTLWL